MGTIHVFFKLVCFVIDIGRPKVKSCDDYNGSGRHTAIWVKIFSSIKLKIPLLCLVCSFAFFSPSPRSSYSNGGQVVALWAVMDANEDPTVSFHRSEDLRLPQDPWCGTWYNPSS